jgi:hypothetical protein
MLFATKWQDVNIHASKTINIKYRPNHWKVL